MVLRRRAIKANRGRAVPVAAPFERSKRADGGFTLIELLVVSIILPVVIGALSLGIVAVFSQQATISGRLSGSTDLQKVDATFIRDIQSATWLSNVPSSNSFACGVSSGGTQLLGMTWGGMTLGKGEIAVSYVMVPNAGGANIGYSGQLERLYCSNGVTTTPSSVQVVSSDVSTSLQQQNLPVVCVGSVTSCQSGSFTGYTTSVVQVSFTLYVPMSTTPFTMVASPRQGVSGSLTGTLGPNGAPVTITDTTCGTALTVSNGSTLSINVGGGTGNGVLDVESNCAGTTFQPISNAGDTNRGAICVSAVVSGALPLPTIPAQPTCPNTNPSVYFGSEFNNVLASLSPPPTITPGLGTCTATSSGAHPTSFTCSPGTYNSVSSKWPPSGGYSQGTLPEFNNLQLNFTGGTYVFNDAVQFTSGINAQFGGGTYAFMSGLDVSAANGAIIKGTNVLLYSPANITFGNSANVNISAGTTTTYDGISTWVGPQMIWDSSQKQWTCPTVSPTPQLTLSPVGTAAYGGVYVPCGLLQSKAKGNISATFVVAGGASFKNNTLITVTPPS